MPDKGILPQHLLRFIQLHILAQLTQPGQILEWNAYADIIEVGYKAAKPLIEAWLKTRKQANA